MMQTASSDAVRKDLILNLYQNEYDKILDSKFQYFKAVETYLALNDAEFFMRLEKIKETKMIKNNHQLIFVHYEEILTNGKYAAYRQQMLKSLKHYLSNSSKDNKFKQYIFKTISSSLYSLSSNTLLDTCNNHLEYYPIINQRVFQIGGAGSGAPSAGGAENESSKEILNVQFKKTYKRFLHLLVHQDLDQE